MTNFNMAIQSAPKMNAFSVLIYGAPKTSKTTFFRGFPSPVFLALSDHGTQFVTGAPCPRIASLPALQEFVRDGHHKEFRTVVLDDLSVLVEKEAARLSATLSSGGKQVRGEGVYGAITVAVMGVIDTLSVGNRIVGITAHHKVGTERAELTPGIVRDRAYVGPRFNPALSHALMSHVSFVLYAYEAGNRHKALTKRVSTERVLIEAGDRSGALPAQIDISVQAGKPATSAEAFLAALRSLVSPNVPEIHSGTNTDAEPGGPDETG